MPSKHHHDKNDIFSRARLRLRAKRRPADMDDFTKSALLTSISASDYIIPTCDRIIHQMEWTRRQHNMSSADFSASIGMSLSEWSRIAKYVSSGVISDSRSIFNIIPLYAFIYYCLVYGCSLDDFVCSNDKQSAIENRSVHIANLISRLSPETLNSVLQVIEQDKAISKHNLKQFSTDIKLLNSIKDCPGNYQPTTFFMPEELLEQEILEVRNASHDNSNDCDSKLCGDESPN